MPMSQLYVDSDKPANVVSPQIVPETSQKTSIYKCENILVSALRDRKIGLLWKDWSHRTVEIFSDGILHWEKASRTKVLDQHILRLKKVEITLMTDTNIANEEINTGVTMKCQTIQGSDTSIRLIFNQLELDKFLTAVRQVADDHNIERMANTKLDIEANKGFTFQIRANSSIMRRAVTSAMDRQSRADRDSRIVAKRVVMKWLPVLGANDLIHGSWWFVIGSIGILLTCIVVIVNKYYEFLSDDDSTLNKISFVTNWILLAISGFFSTLGSLAFVRAFHEDPPMTPLFPKWYHFQSDELLASWLFFLMTVPFVPYCLIYLSDSAYGSLLYLIALALAVVACLGTLLFVRSCYPSDRGYKSILLPISDYILCCIPRKVREKHLVNDWLGGSWLFFWGTVVVCIPCAALILYAIVINSSLQIFTYATSLIETVAFAIGSAYFVAGSYPEISSENNDDDDD